MPCVLLKCEKNTCGGDFRTKKQLILENGKSFQGRGSWSAKGFGTGKPNVLDVSGLGVTTMPLSAEWGSPV
jgi:hypothetical protein